MKSKDDLSALADFGRKWIEEKKENDYKGAKYFWDKSKAKEFSEVGIDDLLFDEYFLDAESWLWSGLVDEIKEFWHEYKYGDKTIFCVIGGFGCLPGYAPIKTPTGYTNIENIQTGDDVIGTKGNSTDIFKIVNKVCSGKKEVFRIYTKDGNYIDATKEHVYKIKRRYWVHGKYRNEIEEWSVEDIINYLNSNTTNSKGVGLIRPKYISYSGTSDLKIDPYVLGVILGDGQICDRSIRITSNHKDAALRNKLSNRLKKYGCKLSKHKDKYLYGIVSYDGHYNKLNKCFREYSMLSKNKYIPKEYLKSSKKDRLELLAGLIDTDGYLDSKNCNSYSITQKRENLIDDIKLLVENLGGKATKSIKRVDGKDYYRLYIGINHKIPCALFRKQNKGNPQRDYRKHIISGYESLGYMETYDITLNSKDHCFLSYNDFITHNSGKTAAFGSIMTWLAWYDFTCKFDPKSDIASPQEYYGLKPTSTVAFIALSKTVKKSKEITFSEIKPSFNSQFNKDYFPVNDRVKSQVQIPNNNTLIFPNTATEAANAGYSVYGYVMDEVSFLEEIEESSRARGSAGDVYDQAAKSFESAEGRRYSRFKNDGIGVLISSVNYDEDFLVSMVRDVYLRPEDHEEKIHKILLPWKSSPSKYNMSDGYFYFDTEKYEIIEDPYKVAALERYYEEPELESLIFEDKEFHKNYEYVKKAERGYYDFSEEEIENAKDFKSVK